MIQVAIMAAGNTRRSRLERRLNADPSLNVVGLAPTFAFLQTILADNAVDAVIIDGTDEINSELARDWVGELLETVPVLLLAAAPENSIFNRVLRAERGAILSRDATVEQIAHALRAICAGLLVFDGSLTPRPDSEDELLTELTARELQVLRLLAEGLSNRDIAERLGISEHTIKFHIASILGKLQASSRTEAVTRGVRSGLIEL